MADGTGDVRTARGEAVPVTYHTWNRWWIVFAAMLGLIVGQGPINVFAAGVFLKPVAQELGFGRGDISTAIGLSSVLTALTVPFFGRLVDLFGVRPMLLWSIALFALATAALSFLTASTAILFLLFAISGVTAVGQTPTAYCKVITAWFDRRRGLALGFALAAVGLGTALIPQLSNALIAHFGWRMGYVGLGVAIFSLAFLPVALFVREPDIAEAARTPNSVRDIVVLPGISFAEATRTWRYWAMTLTFFFAATAISLPINGVEMPGALLRRNFHSWRSRRATAFQSSLARAARMSRAMPTIRSKFRKTRLSPSTCALNTSQLLMLDWRGAPV